jgi:rubrerythrin
MNEQTTEDILKSAILLEKRGRAFYKKIAKQTEYPAVKEFFNMMAAEEETHVAMLSEQYRSYQESGHFKSTEYGEDDAFTGVATKVLSQNLKNEISAADFEAAAIGAAMSMEQGAIDLYAGRAKDATDEHEKALYTWLADWERGHLTFLAEVDQELREEVWNDNSFWPY